MSIGGCLVGISHPLGWKLIYKLVQQQATQCLYAVSLDMNERFSSVGAGAEEKFCAKNYRLLAYLLHLRCDNQHATDCWSRLTQVAFRMGLSDMDGTQDNGIRRIILHSIIMEAWKCKYRIFPSSLRSEVVDRDGYFFCKLSSWSVWRVIEGVLHKWVVYLLSIQCTRYEKILSHHGVFISANKIIQDPPSSFKWISEEIILHHAYLPYQNLPTDDNIHHHSGNLKNYWKIKCRKSTFTPLWSGSICDLWCLKPYTDIQAVTLTMSPYSIQPYI